jgi:hypothetical protein
MVPPRDAQQLGDRRERDRDRELGNDVRVARVADSVEGLVDQGADPRLQ